MRLSLLQKDILSRAVLAHESRLSRGTFAAHYGKRERQLTKDEQNALTVSLERLIERGLLVGYGRKTQGKWYIDAVRLTSIGRKTARALFGKQETLPLKSRHNKNHSS